MLRTIEFWREEKKTPAWIFAGLRVRFPGGSELTESDYDAACDAVMNHVPGRAGKENT